MNVYFLTFHDFANAFWNKLFGMLTLAKGIHDVYDHQWNLVRVFVSDADVLRRRFRRRIRVRRLVAIPLFEQRRPESGTEDFVRAEIKERF